MTKDHFVAKDPYSSINTEHSHNEWCLLDLNVDKLEDKLLVDTL